MGERLASPTDDAVEQGQMPLFRNRCTQRLSK